MQIEFRTRDVWIEPGHRAQIERRLSYILGRFGGLIRRIVIRLEQMACPDGDLDKRCHMQAQLRERQTIVAEVRDIDLDPAITRAASRLTRMLRRRLAEQRKPGSERTGANRGPAVTWLSEY